MDKDRIIQGLQAQLKVLYEEKSALHLKFGVSDYDGLCRLIGSLEAQLNELYAQPKAAETDQST